MQIVMNPRHDPIPAGARPRLSRFAPGVTIVLAGAIVLLLISWLERPRGFLADHWYAVSSVEGVLSYAPYANEADCRAVESIDGLVCVSGAELNR
jgi:hypothetical protein